MEDMEAVVLLICIMVLFICLIATFIYLLTYLGVFGSVKVDVGKPVVKNLWVAYKHHRGSYEKCGPFFTEVVSLCPQLSSIGVYYDDAKVIPQDELRYIVGVIMAEDTQEPPPDILSLLKKHNFQIIEFPTIDYAVRAKFPFCFGISARLGSWKVYPALNRYISIHKLSAHPLIEIYMGNTIHYVMPLSKQNEFFVPEVKYCSSPGSSNKRETETQNASTDEENETQSSESSFEELNVNDSDS